MATRMKKANVVDEVTTDEEVVETKSKKKQFGMTDLIMCHSVTAGGLNVTCPSGNNYRFNDYGADCEIEYRDLVTLVRRSSDYIREPYFVIDDDDFLDEFPQIKKMYASLYTSKELAEILDLPLTAMVNEINNLPSGAKEAMRNVIATSIANGRVDSVKKIRALTDIFDSDFNLLSELFGR